MNAFLGSEVKETRASRFSASLMLAEGFKLPNITRYTITLFAFS
jgi:hypothetical protein